MITSNSPKQERTMSDVKPVPPGFRTITPHLVVKNAGAAIEFYKRALGAEEVYRQACDQSGQILNAWLRIGDSMIMLNDEFPEYGSLGPGQEPSPVVIHLYVDDVDAVFERAVKAGATMTMPVTDMFWGDRYGKFTDPFGHCWSVATHVEDLTPEEIGERAKHAFA